MRKRFITLRKPPVLQLSFLEDWGSTDSFFAIPLFLQQRPKLSRGSAKAESSEGACVFYFAILTLTMHRRCSWQATLHVSEKSLLPMASARVRGNFSDSTYGGKARVPHVTVLEAPARHVLTRSCKIKNDGRPGRMRKNSPQTNHLQVCSPTTFFGFLEDDLNTMALQRPRAPLCLYDSEHCVQSKITLRAGQASSYKQHIFSCLPSLVTPATMASLRPKLRCWSTQASVKGCFIKLPSCVRDGARSHVTTPGTRVRGTWVRTILRFRRVHEQLQAGAMHGFNV